jgi:SAM-dependent methyltransferase
MATMHQCRACRSSRMHLFMAMGPHPPANAFLKPERVGAGEFVHDLDAHVCLDCGLIQVPDVLPPDFFCDYLYVPSASPQMHEHFEELADVVGRFVATGELIVDIGSNDGLFLSRCLARGYRVLGVDPAANLCEIARGRGVAVVNGYFSDETGRRIRSEHGPAKVIVTTNTFNHIDDLHGFVRSAASLLDPAGVFVVEVPHSLDLVAKNEFDTIYHEHLSEFSVKSIVELFSSFDLEAFDIQRLDVHGGSMRIFGRRRTGAGSPASPEVERWLSAERDARLFDEATYRAFTERVERNRIELLTLLNKLKGEGKRLAGYGAPAKGNTLLNYYRIGPDRLDFLADRNSLKHGLLSPGMHIPIVPPEEIAARHPDYLLILAWNFAEEVIQQQQDFRRRGKKFILPIPQVEIV